MSVVVLEEFAAAVGPASEGAVTCVGGRTQWNVGGEVVGSPRQVSAPTGVVAHEPGEMIVRVRAGTTVAEMQDAVGRAGQFVALEHPEPGRATVGGVLSCGHSGPRRLGRGPIRDTVLEVTAVTARGELVRAGAPLVKNVTGFDLCRLMVGSVGTLAFLAEVVLRAQPRPETERWYHAGSADPFDLLARLYRPLGVLWDGTGVWVGLAGYEVDVQAQASILGPAFEEVEGPPAPPGPSRRSLPPGRLRDLPASIGGGRWLAEVGVGLVGCDETAAAGIEVTRAEPTVVELHRRLKERFDPEGRLNPGRSPLAPSRRAVAS